MKKFLIAGSSLAAVAAAGSAGAVDVTLGGSINMGVEFGLGKAANDLAFSSAYNEVSLSINAAHTTDGGLSFGGGFTMGTAASIEFAPYVSGADKYMVKRTVDARTNIAANLWNVSGGGAVASADVVSVKINSSWMGIDAGQTEYSLKVGSFTSSQVCKLAGRGTVGAGELLSATDDTVGAGAAAGSYLPAGMLANGTVNTTHGASATRSGTSVKASVKMTNGTTGTVSSATVYAGPFMEVMMASSETKMVVGVACLTGNAASDTAFYMNNASKVMTVSNASIYIDGGFGRLTLQSSDYAGGVSAIAGAGDAADIDAGGLVVIAQGLGILGANPYLAVDLAAGDSLGDLEVITGGTIDLGGLAASIDVALDNPTDVFGVSSWDLGATYALGDMALAFATDSSTDWGLSASLAIAGFNVSTTFGSASAADHTKSGITYSVGASTALNGFGLSLGFDQDLQPTVGVSYDLGGLALSAGYDAADQGGKLGATLSF